MRKLILMLLISATIAACDTTNYSTAYNLDFEYKADDTRPMRWGLPDVQYHGYATSLDLEQRQHGASSLRMEQTDSTKSDWAIFSLDLPAERVAGQDVELSGWIKTERVRDGFADLYLIQDEQLDFDKLALDTLSRGVRNTTEWTRISVKSHIENHTAGVCIGGILKGGGTAWFDNLELTIDGVKLQDTLLTAPKTRLTRQDKAELLKWRDDCMADDLLWINKQNPLSRIVIWAHNGHIQKCGNKMGYFLKESLGTDYVSVGFTFYDGAYSAIRRSSDPSIHRAQCAYPGTLEYLLEQLDEPIFILDLKKIQSENSPIMAWIDDLNFRHVGAVKIEQEFSDRKITDAFDYLLFIRKSTPSHLL